MKRIALLLLLALFATSLAAEGVTTVILVRHGEKVPSQSDDPPLSEAGTVRANELARVLAGAGVSAIYTTQFKRTQYTAAPLAKALALEPKVIAAGKKTTYAADVVRDIRQRHVGETVLVVGHSNTTVDVLRELGVKELPEIPESQFDDMFVVTIVSGAEPRMVALRYGEDRR